MARYLCVMSALPVIDNRQARHLLMRLYGLDHAARPAMRGAALHEQITRIGYVQVDSINVVERAHHHILFSRGPGYQPSALARLVERDRLLFEHWTHDASIIPIAFHPYWRHRFDAAKDRLYPRYTRHFGAGFAVEIDRVMERICRDGPAMARDFEQVEKREPGWWNWHPSKTALEYLWQTGELAIARREGFQKVYDLSERVIPEQHFAARVDRHTFVDWACREALARLGFATRGEISRFWNLLTPAEVDDWLAGSPDAVEQVIVESSGEPARKSFILAGSLDELTSAAEIGDRVRILSPFDPLLRDRARTERVFGFHYRIEVFVPEARRQYGYYVYPVMRGDRLVGRIDMKAERAADQLAVRKFWPEAGIRPSDILRRKLEAEIDRMRRLGGVGSTTFSENWFA